MLFQVWSVSSQSAELASLRRVVLGVWVVYVRGRAGISRPHLDHFKRFMWLRRCMCCSLPWCRCWMGCCCYKSTKLCVLWSSPSELPRLSIWCLELRPGACKDNWLKASETTTERGTGSCLQVSSTDEHRWLLTKSHKLSAGSLRCDKNIWYVRKSRIPVKMRHVCFHKVQQC